MQTELDDQAKATGIAQGVAVKLYDSKKMSDLTLREENQIHYRGCRVWMEGEYKGVGKKEVARLKELWDSK